MVSITDYH